MSDTSISKTASLVSHLIRLPFSNPRGLREVAGITLSVAQDVIDPEVDVLPIPHASLEELIAAESEPLRLGVCAFPQEPHSISLSEAIGLAVLMRKVRARRVFEFGTHRGVSTSQLASNLMEGGELFSLDLPRNDRRTQYEIDNPGDIEVSQMSVKADLIPPDLRSNVRFLEQDSAQFDPTPFADSMDLVFVDGAHTEKYVLNDSKKAWEMLRPGGIVVWHDCRPQTPDVVRFLRSCPYSPRRLSGGTLAFSIKPGF